MYIAPDTHTTYIGHGCGLEQWRFQPWACPGIARVKFWSIVIIAYGNSVVTYSGSATRVACPGNLAALKPPMVYSAMRLMEKQTVCSYRLVNSLGEVMLLGELSQ